MRIEAYSQINQRYSSEKASTIKQNTPSGKNDKFEISQQARDYQVAKKVVADSTDIREDLVEKIKSQVKAGTYQVSADDFASKVIESYNKLMY